MNDVAHQQLYLPFSRLFKGPMDTSSVFTNLSDAKLYAAGSIAYDGQIISVVNDNTVSLYVVNKGTLKGVPFNLTTGNGTGIDLNITSDNSSETETLQINASIKISESDNNQLSIKDDGGLYVPTPKPSVSKYVYTFTGENMPEGTKLVNINHNLGTTDILISVWSPTNEYSLMDCTIVDENNISVDWTSIYDDDIEILKALSNPYECLKGYKIIIIG